MAFSVCCVLLGLPHYPHIRLREAFSIDGLMSDFGALLIPDFQLGELNLYVFWPGIFIHMS